MASGTVHPTALPLATATMAMTYALVTVPTREKQVMPNSPFHSTTPTTTLTTKKPGRHSVARRRETTSTSSNGRSGVWNFNKSDCA